ncbi:retrovirus-related pol polyprotein from transposon TNT 1-94 [Tanacetum coccineum]
MENRFRRGTIDKTLFIKKIKNDILLVQVYVDDILLVQFEQLMHKRFQMSSIGELTFFLGLQVEQRKDGIFLSRDKYVCDILKKFGFSSVKTVSTPMKTHKPLSKDTDGTDVDVHLYRSMIGSLMYLTSFRPDIMFATKIHVDNESAICVVKNPVYHSKTKNIEIRHHFIRDSYEKKLIEMVKIHTDYNVADLLTKAFDVTRFQFLIASIAMVGDEAVHKELGDIMERAATTASSLKLEQDSSNIK